MPKDIPNVTRGLNRVKLPFLVGYVADLVAIGGQDCKLPENEGHSENRVQMAFLVMSQMSQMGPISKSCLFWVVTWPLGVEVAIS